MPEPDSIRVQIVNGGAASVRQVPFEEYVAAAALSEFAPSAGDSAEVSRMFEVQEIITRTYAIAHLGRHAREGFDLCSTTHCQRYDPDRLATSRWAGALTQASARSAGRVLLYGGAPAEVVYHADCGGHTSSAQEVWGGTGRPYLVSSTDDGAAGAAHSSWEYAVDANVLRRALNADARTSVGSRLAGIAVASRDESGRARDVLLDGDRRISVKGTDVRDVMTAAFGARALRSTLFDVTRRGNDYVFRGRGFGHGVGLCQAGAYARIRAGESVGEVLQTYLPGTQITTLK